MFTFFRLFEILYFFQTCSLKLDPAGTGLREDSFEASRGRPFGKFFKTILSTDSTFFERQHQMITLVGKTLCFAST